jgi:predicted ester cyclase
MPVEDNKQAARRFYQEVINARNLDALDELLTPDGVDHTFGSQNPDQAKQFFGMVHQAFPDLHAEVHDLIAEGELVAARVTYTSTHQGEFLGIPATGRKTTTSGGRLLPDAGRPAGRALGWAGHVQLPDAAGRHARTGHAGARHARLTVASRARPPRPGGASGPAPPP